MNRNEILEAARKNPERGSEYENKVSVKSNLWGALISAVLCILLVIVEVFAKNTINYGLLAVGTVPLAVQQLYEGIVLKKKWAICVGIFLHLLVILEVCAFIKAVTV